MGARRTGPTNTRLPWPAHNARAHLKATTTDGLQSLAPFYYVT